MLGISYKALLYKMRQFNLDSGRGARSAARARHAKQAAKEAGCQGSWRRAKGSGSLDPNFMKQRLRVRSTQPLSVIQMKAAIPS